MRPIILSLAAACLLIAVPARAGSLYVACDNGLDCVTAPCPSTTVRDLSAGTDMQGIYPDIDSLPERDRQRIRDTDALYYGRLVLRGHIEDRTRDFSGRSLTLPTLVVTGIARAADAAERRHCPAG